MILPVVKYGSPVLRKRGSRIETATPEIHALIADMFETMYSARGIGLAAQQVGQALQLAIIDVRGVKDRPSTLWVKGTLVEPESMMPMVLINPELKPMGGRVSGPEGCLSFPEIYGEIDRPEMVEVRALSQRGEPLEFRAGGLLARAIQHEADHLNGILFIDRMDPETFESVRSEVETLEKETRRGPKR